MITTVVLETTSHEELGAAEAILRAMGYPVSPAADGPRRLHEAVRPGERPQAALRDTGISFRLVAAQA